MTLLHPQCYVINKGEKEIFKVTEDILALRESLGVKMTLMKLRLALLFRDLAARFKISAGLCSQIFHSRIRTMAKCLKSMIFLSRQ